jgi:ferric-dicitrate binding protein FerR (iron transport regulator)
MKYATYTVEDFVNDAYFHKWVKEPDRACHTFWQDFLNQYPEKVAVVEEAREIVSFLSFDVIQPEKGEQEEVKALIMQEIALEREKKNIVFSNDTPHEKPLWSRKSLYTAAAIFIGITLCTIVFTVLNKGNSATVIHTPYAQTKKITLPDGSTAILNANSTLRYMDNWQQTHKREVWLTGEAYFEVRKKPEWSNARFSVLTDSLHVEVLGTTFNVNNRRGKVKVVLNTGKVQLKSAGSNTDTLTMQPKDLVEFSSAGKVFLKKKVNPEEHSSWRNHKLIFNETSLQEIASVLEDNYGLTVVFKEPGFYERKFTGAIPNQDINLFLTILSQSMNMQMTKNKDTIYINF